MNLGGAKSRVLFMRYRVGGARQQPKSLLLLLSTRKKRESEEKEEGSDRSGAAREEERERGDKLRAGEGELNARLQFIRATARLFTRDFIYAARSPRAKRMQSVYIARLEQWMDDNNFSLLVRGEE